MLANSLQVQVENGVATLNLSMVSELLASTVRANADLDYIVLMHQSGLAHIHTQKPELEMEFLNRSEDLFAAGQKQPTVNEYQQDERRFLEFIMPVPATLNPWGVLRLGFSLDRMSEEIAESRRESSKKLRELALESAALAALFIALGAGVVLFLSKRLSKPLVQLTRWAGRLAEGDFSLKQRPTTGTREIDALSSAFEGMTTRLQESYGQLEQQVIKRTNELALARDQAVAANNSKSEFLSMISHEIRTPMNAIIGLTGLMLKTGLTDKQRDYLNKIDASARVLLEIINDILDFSKVEAGKLELESIRFDLNEVLANLSTLMGVRAEEKGLRLHFSVASDVPRLLVGDPLRLGQVLLNLVGNAIKFTERGEILVDISLLEMPPESHAIRLQFVVKDTGIGLSGHQIGKLFQPFIQADSSITRKYGGTGLGLAICKRLVAMMHGRIWAESRLGEGSSFAFTARFQECREARAENVLNQAQGQLHALIVDDDTSSCEVLRAYLESFSFKVEQVDSGERALEVIKQTPYEQAFQLVVVDWKLPQMDGLAFARAIRGLSGIPMPRIIMITAHGREDVFQQVKASDVDGFLIKPVHPSVLYNAIVDSFNLSFEESPTRNETTLVQTTVNGCCLLLVEDHTINQQIAKELLEGQGAVVDIADNGLEAIKKLQARRYDVVLMDLEMPVLDGFATTEKLRADARYASLPIIAMTAHAMEDVRQRCLAVGMDGYITKPIDSMELLNVLREVTNNQKPAFGTSLDFEQGIANAGHNSKLFQRLLSQFREEFSNASDQLQTLLEQSRFDEAARLIHTIKGIAANLAMPELTERCAELERRLKHEPAYARDALPAWRSALEKVRTIIGQTPISKSTTRELPVDPAVTERVLGYLLNALRHSRLDIDRYCERLQTLPPPEFDDDGTLCQAVHEFDFEAAERLLQSKAQQIFGHSVRVCSDPDYNDDRATLLIVDDMPINIRSLASLLGDYALKVAVTGDRALRVIEREAPDLILLDIEMPGMSGLELCRHLKQNDQTANIPVIFITGRDEISDMTQAFELGAVDYVAKPFNAAVLKARINTHLELKKQRDQLERLAAIDGLTGIPSRRMFDTVFAQEWHRALRQQSSLAVIFIDIDFFKPYNDFYGHSQGDHCLRQVARLLKQGLNRAADFVARYGGEEFIAVLPETELDEAIHIAEMLRQQVARQAIPHERSTVADHVTLSLGVSSVVPKPETPPDLLLKAADTALYKAKGRGRNRLEAGSDLS